MGGGGSQNASQLTLHRCACIIGKSVSCVLGLTRRNVSRYAQLYQWDLIIIVSFRLGLLSIYIYMFYTSGLFLLMCMSCYKTTKGSVFVEFKKREHALNALKAKVVSSDLNLY